MNETILTDADDHTHTAEVEIALGVVSTGDNATEQPGVGDVEEKSQIDKEDIPKGWQETEKKTSTFQFKKRGKLNANEVVELKKTHRSLFDWVKREGRTNTLEEDPMEWEDQSREMNLEKARVRKLEWATRAAMKKLALEIVNEAVKKAESRHCEDIVLNAVERAWEDIEVNRVLQIIWNTERSVQERVERSMAASRREEEFLVEMVLKEESKEKRLERARLKTMTSKRKFEAVKWRRMLELLRSMELMVW